MTVNPAKSEFKAEDFSDLGEMPNIRSALFRMSKTGRLEKAGHGIYKPARKEDVVYPLKFRKEDMLNP